MMDFADEDSKYYHARKLPAHNTFQDILSERLVQWDEEYIQHHARCCLALDHNNQSILLHYQQIQPRPNAVKLPAVRNVLLTFPQLRGRPKGRLAVSVRQAVRTGEMTELKFLPHYDSIQEYCKVEEKMPEIAQVYQKITLPSHIRKHQIRELPESQYNDFLLTRVVACFGAKYKHLHVLAKVLHKDIYAIISYLLRLNDRLHTQTPTPTPSPSPSPTPTQTQIQTQTQTQAQAPMPMEIQTQAQAGKEQVSTVSPQSELIPRIGRYNKSLFCNICFVYCCNLHLLPRVRGREQQKLSLDLNKIEWPVVTLVGTNGKALDGKESMKQIKPRFASWHNEKTKARQYRCRAPVSVEGLQISCVHADGLSSNALTSIQPLSPDDVHTLLELLKLRVNNSCFLAYLMNKVSLCLSIHAYLSSNMYLLSNQCTNQLQIRSDVMHEHNNGVYVYYASPGTMSYTPCNHRGLCTRENDCPCAKRRGMCEKFCLCKKFCPRQYGGCECKTGLSCSSRSCKCFVNNRECDPDLCSCCAGNASSGEAIETHTCINMSMTLNRQKQTRVGLSQICEGYGLFAAEDILKGGFICEYLGELISKEEGERRGILSDISGCTYLFELTQETYIDARMLGSKMRYANHASHGMENAVPKVLYVNGIPRIGLYALRDIQAHEELLFNYRIRKQLPWIHQYKTKYQLPGTTSPTPLDSD